MAAVLENKIKGMTLIEEEEEIVDCDMEEEEEINEQLMLCLVGKLLTSNPFSIDVMKNTMRSAWKLNKGMVVREIDNNVFIFQFFAYSNKIKVLEEGLWTFDGVPLILKEIEEGIQPSKLVFDTARLWVKVEDLPLNKRTKSMAISMASKMGTFVDFDEFDPIGWSKYMRFRVDLKIDKPLRQGMRIAILFEIERDGDVPRSQNFREALDDCGLQDLGFHGMPFTWWYRQADEDALYERSTRHRKLEKKVRFEDIWLFSPECENVVKEAWLNSMGTWNADEVLVKIKRCSEALYSWSKREFGCLSKKIKVAREKLVDIDGCEPTYENVQERQKVCEEINVCGSRRNNVETTIKSIKFELKEGDQNTKFFHMKASRRRRRNAIHGIQKDNGEWANEQDKISANVVELYRVALPTSKGIHRRIDSVSALCTRCKRWEESEIHAIWSCNMVRCVWEEVNLMVKCPTLSNAKVWLELVLLNVSKEDISHVLMLAWEIWNERNVVFHRVVPRHPVELAAATGVLLTAFKELQVRTAIPCRCIR
uniref:DUF4283 domain-containing protein n=1 Tax=Chenopodium quinoa TaxID=63459 RepID=A0A803ML34_CHEQI